MKRALVDLSSVIWTSLLNGKDKEFGKWVLHEGKDVLINSASWGYDNAMEYLDKVMTELHIPPRHFIFVMEGKESKSDRQSIYPGYKFGRDKVPEQYEQFNIAKELVMSAFLGVGAQVCWQDGGVEADDVLGYLAANLKGERWIISADKDLAQCVNPDLGIHHYRAHTIDENPFGQFAHRFIPVNIALVGDSSDKIPGAKGFGKVAFEMMHLTFGDDGLEMMEGLIKNRDLLRLEEDVPVLRELQRVIDSADSVYTSYELGRLRIERVNTLRRPLQWRVGMVKPRDDETEQLLRKHAGVNRIVSAENYDEAMAWAKKQIDLSPYVSLDIETSTPPESDEWMESRDRESRVDVFGSKLTSLQMTFGPNCQYTFYLPFDNVEEEGVSNLAVEQIANFVDMVPRDKVMYIQNVAFELPICYMSWGEMWKDDPLYHGFLRNVRDTKIMSSYVDENFPAGLKDNSKRILGYEQKTYAETCIKDCYKEKWDGVGKVLQTYLEPILEDTGELEEVVTGYTELKPSGKFDEHGEDILEAQPIKNMIPKMKHIGDKERIVFERKMNQMTAKDVADYGCDDTICTVALANHFQVIMEIEHTDHVFEQVETYPAYLTALAYVQGTDFSLQSMAEQEKDDNVAYDAAWATLREYLIKIGFEGTKFEPITDLEPTNVKRAVLEVTGRELLGEDGKPARVRKLDKLVKLLEMQDPESILPQLLTEGKIDLINQMMEANFDGEPKLDLGSPKQMKALLYEHMNIPVKVINDVTDTEKKTQPELAMAVKKFKQLRSGKSMIHLTDAEKELMKKKAKTDDTAIDFAIAFDRDVLDDEAVAALKAVGVMKKVMTRRNLFYANYWKALHWKDGKLHCNVNQCAAVTRRYSMSDQNLQQLPKKGEAVRFRSHFPPHKKNAVVCSIDFMGQELRLAAEESQDKNMLACYVGDNLKDIHSITAAGAMRLKWGNSEVDALFEGYGQDLKKDIDGTYDLFLRLRNLGKAVPIGKKADDLRKDSKNINFGAQNGAMAVKLSEVLVMTLEDAQLFLDAREKMFPGVAIAAKRIVDDTKRLGYATTFMGARRHLRDAILSDDNGVVDRAARQAWNFRIQSSAGEMTKLAMARLWLSGIFFRYDARFIAPIHDELVTSVTADHAVDFIREKHEAMTKPYAHMKVPVMGSISFGPNFADQHEVGDWFIEENICKALSDIFEMKEAA